MTAAQIAALEERLETLHEASALSDDELYALEDCLADFLDAKAGCGLGLVTVEVAHSNAAVGKLHRLIVLSEGMTKDAAFSRQVRRKFV